MSEQKKLTTASGRESRRIGMNDSKKSALAKLREARSGSVKRTDQYEVSYISFLHPLYLLIFKVEEAEGVFEELAADDYEKRQKDRMNDDFIVDDEGFGYKDDHGGEIWEYNEDGNGDVKKKKQRKLNVSFFLILKYTYFSSLIER